MNHAKELTSDDFRGKIQLVGMKFLSILHDRSTSASIRFTQNWILKCYFEQSSFPLTGMVFVWTQIKLLLTRDSEPLWYIYESGSAVFWWVSCCWRLSSFKACFAQSLWSELPLS
jgi:hypothetical protein